MDSPQSVRRMGRENPTGPYAERLGQVKSDDRIRGLGEEDPLEIS
jgi:hypothetical protein